MTILTADEVRTTTGAADADVLATEQVAAWLPDEGSDSHKGSCGYALVVAGSVNYTGAAYLAGAGAYRAGAGLVTVALPNRIHGIVAGLLPEATYLALSEDLGVLSKAGASVVREEWGRYDALLVGPGLTSQRPAREFLQALLEPDETAEHHASGPIGFFAGAHDEADAPAKPAEVSPRPSWWVVDADGLNILAEWPDGLKLLPPDAVLTPHPGEMARLTGLTAAEVNADRVGVCTRWAGEWGHTVALKGALTVVAAPDGRTAIVPFANPTLATAGSGDVMSGAVVGFLAQGLAPFEAAAAAAYAHGLAGEIAGARHGRRGATATDIARCLSEAVERIEGGDPPLEDIADSGLGEETTTASRTLRRLAEKIDRLEGKPS